MGGMRVEYSERCVADIQRITVCYARSGDPSVAEELRRAFEGRTCDRGRANPRANSGLRREPDSKKEGRRSPPLKPKSNGAIRAGIPSAPVHCHWRPK